MLPGILTGRHFPLEVDAGTKNTTIIPSRNESLKVMTHRRLMDRAAQHDMIGSFRNHDATGETGSFDFGCPGLRQRAR
jgi:hypothetical protein